MNSQITRAISACATFVVALVLPLSIVVAYAYAANSHYMALLRAGVAPSTLGALTLVLAGLVTVMLLRKLHGEHGIPDSLLQLPAGRTVLLTAATALLVIGGGTACVLGSKCTVADGGEFFYRFLLPHVPYIALAALYEELYFREALYRALLRVFGRTEVAMLVQAVLFGLAHYAWGRELAIAMGIWFGMARIWTGSIWACAVVHAVGNVVTYALYGKVGMTIHLLKVTPPGAETQFATAVVVAVLGILLVWRRLVPSRASPAARLGP